MSYEPPWQRRRRGVLVRRWVWRSLVLGAVGSLVISLVWRSYYQFDAEEEVERTVARVDAADPHWRWEDILAQRAAVADEQNAARIISSVAERMPSNWPTRSAITGLERGEAERLPPMTIPWYERVEETVANFRLDEEVVTALRGELTALAALLAEVRRLIDGPRSGRFDIQWERNYLGTRMAHLMQVRQLAGVLQYDACLRTHDGDVIGGLASCRGVLAAGRSLGDEPIPPSQMVRFACQSLACRSVERVLGQGIATAKALKTTQALLAAEEAESQGLLLLALRGERALLFNLFDALAEGERVEEDFARLASGARQWSGGLQRWLCLGYRIRYCQASALGLCTDGIEAMQQPYPQRRAALGQWSDRLRQFQRSQEPWRGAVAQLLPAFPRLANSQLRSQVTLYTTQLALAAERFRLTHGRWPQVLNELSPEFIALQADPFSGKPYMFQRRPNGIVIYSVGPDGVDNGGELFRGNRIPNDVDLGLQLWDPLFRARLPMPPGEMVFPSAP